MAGRAFARRFGVALPVLALPALVALLVAPGRSSLAAAPDTAPPLPPPAGTVVNVSTEPQLQAAVASLTSGTTIVIAPGTYHLTSTLWVVGPLTDVAIRGATNNRNDVVLVGRGMTNPNTAGVGFGIWTGGGVTRVAIANLTIRDVFYHPLIFNAGTQQPHVYNVRLLDAGDQFIKSNPDPAGGGVNGGIVEYSVIEYTTEAPDSYTNGVDVHTGNDWIIRHNLFRRIRSSGGLAGPAVLVWNGSQRTIVESNTFIDNHRDIHLGLIERTPNDHTGGIVRNNMIVRSPGAGGDVGIGIFDSPGTTVVHNSVWMGGAYANAIEYRFPDTTGVIIANNLSDAGVWARQNATATLTNNVWTATAAAFESPATGDLHLSAAASIAIDRVPVHPDAPFDWDGSPRPSGLGADLGADERTAVVQLPAPPEVCADGVDNDGDGVVDDGCPPPPPVPALELCGDGVDNDADGLVDENCGGLGPAVTPGPPARVSARASGSTIAIQWLAPIVGGRATGYLLEAGLAPGMTVATLPLGPQTSVSIPNVGAGTYYVRLRAMGPAGLGPASNESAVTVGACPAPAAPWPLVGYVNGSRIALTWFDAAGCQGRGLHLVAGTHAGGADLAVVPVSSSPLDAVVPAGEYFLRVASPANTTSNEVRLVVPGGCPPPAFPIRLSGRVAGNIVDLQWYPTPSYAATALDAVSPLAYVLEAGRAPGSADVGVFPLGRTASFLAAAPAGHYHLRVRAVTACGAGPASNDVTLTVP
ncbi:MAG: MopE-related protein [Vicinamibacterales bacterium]